MTDPELKHAKAGFGLSVTSNVLSAFDQQILAHIKPGSVVYDIGAGEGALALACAAKGARVHAFDLSPSPGAENIIWHQQDIRDIDCTAKSWEAANILIFRRILYYFSYAEARQIIANFKQVLKADGKVFCSLIALHSDYAATDYPSDFPIEQRFAIADNAAAKKFNLLHPVCIYTEDEARLLFVEAGLNVIESGQSNWSVYITAAR